MSDNKPNNAATPPPPFANAGGTSKPAPQAPPQAPPQAAPAAAPQAPPQAPPQAAPQAPPQAAPAAAPQNTAAPVEEPKKKRNAPIQQDHIQYVTQNVSKRSYTEMADNLGISKAQVNRILQEIKKGLRNKALADAEANGTKAYTQKENGRNDYKDPQTDMAKKIENYIQTHLSRPEETRPGAGKKGGGGVSTALNSEVYSIIANL
jgi:hypothetical protein